MTGFLLVAEVDKIQSFVFQSSRLREVVGASHLLEKFCKAISGDPKKHFPGITLDILASGGGSFRIVVEGDEAAVEAVGRDLREAFQREVGGSITITHVPFEPKKDVIERGNEALRRAKIGGDAPQALWHLPYHAICESSGSELAVAYERPGGLATERPRYLGPRTREKADVSAAMALLETYADAMAELPNHPKVLRASNATEADTYAVHDPRQYVAYLVSDGNSMGELFGQCTPDEYRAFSKQVPQITMDAIIHAVERMGAETHRNGDIIFPVLPLITGGDDVFMLMPAPWAIDVAARFCETYEKNMTAQLNKMGKKKTATTGVAVVICKASYPYRLAHQHGDDLLNQAKRRAKKEGTSCWVVDFVSGNDTIGNRGDLPPQPHTIQEAQKYFLPLRYDLRDLPNKKRYELAEAVRAVVMPAYKTAVEKYRNDKDKFEKVRADVRVAMTAALSEQGSESARLVKRIDTTLYPDQGYGGLLMKTLAEPLDFLEIVKLWDFALDMRHPREDYRSTEA